MSTTSTKRYEIAVKITEHTEGKPGILRVTNTYISLAELMDLIDDEQAKQIEETVISGIMAQGVEGAVDG